MGRIFATLAFTLAAGLAIATLEQQGDMGRNTRGMANSIERIDAAISAYLNGDEIKCILSPGEFVSWKLSLKAGQVVIAEARSDAFDPALEIVDTGSKSLAQNDDRYPGDQRPLLFWRCEKDGEYALHLRCFHDKSGGQAFVRFRTYDSVDLSSGEKVEADVDTRAPFLLRIPMVAGQIKEILDDVDGKQGYMHFYLNQVIAPGGLPEESPSLTERINPAVHAIIAPVSGDYYVLSMPYGRNEGRAKIHVGTREITPQKLVRDGNSYTVKAPINRYAIWELTVKAGEFLRASTPELAVTCQLTLANEPDFRKYDVAKPETNPFYPQKDQTEEPAFDLLSARARDMRIVTFRARRDAKLWLSSDAGGPVKEFTLRVVPGASDFAEQRTTTGNLRISDTDYWAFDAKAGDVMALSSAATKFDEMIIVRDPDLREVRHFEAALDQTADNWRMIVQKPGRYLLAVSCLGNGGGGEYSLSRKVFHSQEFGAGNPARGDISSGQVQIWSFKVTPDNPLFIHWMWSKSSYDVEIYDDKGQRTDIRRQRVDDHNEFGILKVAQPETFVIVLTGTGEKSSYSIELGGIPGYKPAK